MDQKTNPTPAESSLLKEFKALIKSEKGFYNAILTLEGIRLLRMLMDEESEEYEQLLYLIGIEKTIMLEWAIVNISFIKRANEVFN
jgi:hypothetical protein